MGDDITELSLLAALLAGAVLTSGFYGWKLKTSNGNTLSGDRLSAVANDLVNGGFIRNVRRGQYGVTASGKLLLTTFQAESTYKRRNND